MAYVGTPIDTRNTFQSLQGKRFNGDGSTTAFTLDVAPSSTLDIEVFVGNVRQDPNSAYTLSGTTLTFTGAPPSGTNNIYVVHQAKSVGTIDLPEGALVDLNGGSDKLVLDADGDTTISADTDDQIDFKTGGTDRLKIDSTDVTVSTGNIVFGTANKGVYLGVTSATASNLLDDYEEGIWTATCVVDGGAMSLESGHNTGSYVKIGNLVNVQGFFKVDATNASGGFIGIAGLPFASAGLTEGQDYSAGSVFVRSASSAVGGGCVGWIEDGGQSSFALRENGTTGVGNTLTNHFDAGTDFTINVTYRTA